jgi:hypothetical protein
MNILPRRPDRPPAQPLDRSPRLPPAVWAKLGGAAGLAALVAVIAPRTSRSGSQPPVGVLLLSAALISLVMLSALVSILRRDLRLPVQIALYAVLYNALVIVVKFVLAPHGFYEVNQHTTLESWATPDSPVGAAFTAGLVFVLYVVAFWAVYRFARRRVETALALPPTERRTKARALLIPVISISVLGAASGGALLLIPLIVASAGLNYLDFVFASGASLAIAISLAGATTLAAMAFKSAGDRAIAAADASMVVSVFWVGLAFLAIFHAIWVVYILVLTSIWPLKVVVPK